MKTFKLCVHKKKEDILVSSKDFPDVKAGDVVELYHADDQWNRLLLQVKCLPEEQKDAVSIEQSIANAFSLRPYNSIVVNKVEPQTVSLDLVELLFKEQYFGRSEMWRLCKTLTNTCVYLKKTVAFTDMKAQVYELWARGENVTCGVITEDTKFVFRSPTAVVQIFIQMSSEMWDFDLHGDLYFEKAVNGFLTDLFDKWKEQNCLHDVTVVLFSRTFYEAQSLEEFPPSVRECLQIDCKGRIYEDFYRVIVQNERYEEWSQVLKQLRTLFNTYQNVVLDYHSKEGHQQMWKMPKAKNSVASQGNFLETLNMSLNLFENYYLDRNFDRTGKVSVVITPGPGVFEVDRQLANITKQRTIDCGVGSDLVCMGEQPLHAAPLFKFHSKSTLKSIEVGDDYNIPHWMNHSFYMSKNQIEDHMNFSFVPRIKPPPALLKELEEGPKITQKNLLPKKDDTNEDNIPFVDYDEYDAQTFKLPLGTMPRTLSVRGAAYHSPGYNQTYTLPKTFNEAKQRLRPRQRHISDEVSAYMNDYKDTGKDMSAAISIPSRGTSQDDMSFSFGCYPIHEQALSRDSYESGENDEVVMSRPIVGSAGSPVGHSRNLHNYRPHRALINPFTPSRLQFKMTSNRRRWVHAFPVDHKGMQMQARHVHSVAHSEHDDDFPFSSRETLQSPHVTVTTKSKKSSVTLSSSGGHLDSNSDLYSQGGDSVAESPISRHEHGLARRLQAETGRIQPKWQSSSHSKLKIFGSARCVNKQEWSPDMNTGGYDWRPLTSDLRQGSRLTKSIYSGDFQSNSFNSGIPVDWKSLTIPASLPVTTDYFPDRRSLQYDYVLSEYELLPEDIEVWTNWASKTASLEDKMLSVYRRQSLSTQDVFLELISQRLGQGFQLITKKKSRPEGNRPMYIGSQSTTGFMRQMTKVATEEYYMSIGRIYHVLTLTDQTIRVTRYRPRHPQPQLHYEYKYRFQAPDSFSYDVSWTHFSNEKLENYNWNHLDQYICTQGDWDFGLIDSLKYWRSRFLLLPNNNPATKKIIDRETTRCDIYEEKSEDDLRQLIVGFLKFLESMNKLKKSNTHRKSKAADAPSAVSLASASTATVSSGDSSPRKTDDGSKDKEERLNVTSSPNRLIEAMADPVQGVTMLQNQAGLPMNTFISAEAVTWCCQNVFGVESTSQAIAVMQRLMDSQLVLHASGNPKHKFIYGFYLYYIPQRLLAKPGQVSEPTHPITHVNTPGANYNCLFQNEWCEVTVMPVSAQTDEDDSGSTKDSDKVTFYVPEAKERKRSDSMLAPEVEDWRLLTGQGRQQGQEADSGPAIGSHRVYTWYKATLLHKYVNVEVDPQKKSERKEFAIARYHAYYSPKCAFELQLQWMVSTGCILGELVYAFARRATSCGFHLIPVPCDPFALPYTENSDPLRGPIFVPLNMQALGMNLFSNCTDEKRQEMLYVIQDAIVKRFGFLPASVKVPEESSSGQDPQNPNYNHQYVHCTAGMFILIPESNPAQPLFTVPRPPSSSSSSHIRSNTSTSSPLGLADSLGFTKKPSTELHKLYIARQGGRPEHAPNEVGFLWSWNYMSSRRWRTPHTGDERFQDTMLDDFRKFCSNSENRLTDFWLQFRRCVDL